MESHESERDAVVNLHLKKKWFDKIKSGQKKHEYRLATPYWEKRLNRRIKVSLYCGYPKKGDWNKCITFSILKISRINGKHTDLAVDADVFDIELGEKLA